MRRQKFEPGAIVRIALDGETHTYGRILRHPFVAIYDCRVREDLSDPNDIIASPVLFAVAVMERAVTGGRWQIVGRAPLDKGGIRVPSLFVQDRFDPQRCRIIDSSGASRDATIEECEGLERAAVWEAEHVEERIRDHYAGRKNVHLESMRIMR